MNLTFSEKLLFIFQRIWIVLFIWTLGTGVSGVFILHTDWQRLIWQGQAFEAGSATIQSAAPTSFSINEETVYQYTYTYQVGRQSLSGTSYSSFTPEEVPPQVRVYYHADQPAISHLQHMRRAEIPLWAGGLLLGVIFLPVQLLWVFQVRNITRKLRILREGSYLPGTLIQNKRTGTTRGSNPKTNYSLTYEYKVADNLFEVSTSTQHPGTFKGTEWVMYHPQYPKRALLVPALPEKLRAKVLTHHAPSVALQPSTAPQDLALYDLLIEFPHIQFRGDEVKRWEGKALPGLRSVDIHYTMLLVGVAFLGFMGFILYTFGLPLFHAFTTDFHPELFILMAGIALFTATGYWLSFGRLQGILQRRRKTRYVLTNYQVIRIIGDQVKTWELAQLEAPKLKLFRDKAGIISFGLNYQIGPIMEAEEVYPHLTDDHTQLSGNFY